MMAQEIPIRASSGRILFYGFDENTFEMLDMLVDYSDIVDILENKSVGLWDRCVDVSGDVREFRSQVFFIGIGESGSVDEIGEFAEAETR